MTDDNTQMQMPETQVIETKTAELLKDVEKQVPNEICSQHDTDVGLVQSARPDTIVIKTGARLPCRNKYPLRPDAEQGIKSTIEGLIKAGVLIETSGYCNTPILPIAKIRQVAVVSST